MARLMNLGRGIVNVCKNEGYAESFVQDCQIYGDKVYEKMGDLTERDEERLNSKVYEAMVYKTGFANMSLWSDCGKVDFRKKDPQYGIQFLKRLENASIILIGLQVAVSFFNSIEEIVFYRHLTETTDISFITAHCKKASLPFAIFEAIIGLSIIYLLLVHQNVNKRIVRKEDPFTTTHLISMLIFFVIVQRVIFKAFFFGNFVNDESLGKAENPRLVYNMVSTARYAAVSLEFLFIIIPIRHNFQIHNLELV